MNRLRKLKWWLVAGFFLLLAMGLAALHYQSQMGLSVDRTTHAQVDILSLKTQLSVYWGMNGSLPTTEQGLGVLVTRPDTASSSWKQLLFEVPVDPWTRPYVYRRSGISKVSDFDLFSFGPDGIESHDDIRAER
ncbi:MAG: type II secretion system protein GspG [Verrucomicrobiaceae bacterium]|nr:MAG: type II secretion system protein GspG [Verrucomicrobiaceae bacterium]